MITTVQGTQATIAEKQGEMIKCEIPGALDFRDVIP